MFLIRCAPPSSVVSLLNSSSISSFRAFSKWNFTYPCLAVASRRQKMSAAKPSAFDALMSSARAAAKRKPLAAQVEVQEHSPKKQKSKELRSEQINLATSDDAEVENPSSQKVKNPKPDVEDRVAKVKNRISLLKNKAAEFDPADAVCWEKETGVPFLFMSCAFDLIANETGRLVITDIVCNMLRTVMSETPDDLLAVVYLLANKIAPSHEGVELGIGEAIIIKALSEACGRTEKQVKSQYKEMGDLGLVAKSSRGSQSMMRKPAPLSVAKVFETFHKIAKESGKDSQEKKKNHIKSLLVAATDSEPLYLIRLLQSKLRIGLAEQTLLSALAQAALYSQKRSKISSSSLEDAIKTMKKVYSTLPVYDKIIPVLLSDGIGKLPSKCSFSPGVPVGPMLAKATKGVAEIVDKFHDMDFTCEYKYDGERAQIHYLENGTVEIYSRNAERNTLKFPDVVLTISRLKNPSVTSFILDCELVAFDRDKNKILPFQVLTTRARKNVSLNDIKVNVCIYAFDVLFLNGESLIQEQLELRRERLLSSFNEEPGYFRFATALTSNDLEEIQKFLDAAVDASCEGLIIKTLNKDATYEPSKRSHNWLKLKKDYMESIGDSLDLVPIAAFHGRGKRTGVYGAFLLACYDGNNDEYQSICKIGTGFSEAMLEERSASLRSKVIPSPKSYYRCGDNLKPDVWFEPCEVWEVKAADLTISPVHRAAVGEVDPEKGISLRFPRLLRVREDKSPEQATNSEQVADMYNAQKHNHPVNDHEDDD